MLNHSASLAMSTSVLKALPGKLDIKRHSPSILYIQAKSKNKLFKILQAKVFGQAFMISRLNVKIDDTENTEVEKKAE